MKLLHIDSSVLGPHSVSRQVSAAIVDHLRKATPGLEIVYRDLTSTPLAHLSGSHLAAAQGAAPDAALREDLAAGQAVLDEFFAADIVVLGAPMYNFTFERRQNHTPCTPIMTAARDTKRPIPENSAIVTNSWLPEFSDAAVEAGSCAATRMAFVMSISPYVIKNPDPWICRTRDDEGSNGSAWNQQTDEGIHQHDCNPIRGLPRRSPSPSA